MTATIPFERRVRDLLDYNPETGEFTWRVNHAARARAGQRAGSIGHWGYRTIRIDKRDYRAARLVFLMMKGSWPEGFADHINGCRSDDRWENLRPATRSENSANAKQRTDQKTAKGVSFHKKAGRWSASIQVRGEARHLGLFDTSAQASTAYNNAARNAFGPFARTS